METNWLLYGFLLMTLASILIFQDQSFESACGFMHIKLEKKIETIGDLECVLNAEILDPFILTLGSASFLCYSMAILTLVNKKLKGG